MDIQACYAALGGNYNEAIGRLQMDRLVIKFARKYLTDPSYDSLCAAVSAHDRDEAFRAAHTLKGVCRNLAFTKLGDSASALTEALRDQWDEDRVPELFAQVQADHQQTICAIEQLEG